MATALSHLIKFWRGLQLDAPPYVPASDKDQISQTQMSLYRSIDEYISHEKFGQQLDKTLHTGLLPTPYVGSLKKASVFVLMLNPGLSHGDYFAEYTNKTFRDAFIRNLRQQNARDTYPLLFLDPQFAWHPGSDYWLRKFASILREVCKRKGLTYKQALTFLSQQIACLELFPYHSKEFGAGALINRLPSVSHISDYVQGELEPRAKRGEITIVVARGATFWNLQKGRNIVVYRGTESRSAHLSIASRGGRAIANQIGL